MSSATVTLAAYPFCEQQPCGSSPIFKPCPSYGLAKERRFGGPPLPLCPGLLLSPSAISGSHLQQPKAFEARIQGTWPQRSCLPEPSRCRGQAGPWRTAPAALRLSTRHHINLCSPFDVSPQTGAWRPALRTQALKLAYKLSFQEESCLLCLRANQPGPVKARGVP